MGMPMLRLPSNAVRSWATKNVAPILGIKTRGACTGGEGFPPVTPTRSGTASVNRKSFVLEHTSSMHLEDIYDITPGKELGAGGFGTVRKATLKSAQTVARAVKTVQKCDMKAEESIRREIAILKHLDHPSICRLIETFEDGRCIYLVLELIDGRELFDEIMERRSLDERWAAGIMYQVFGALKYCHDKNVMHRDLKPENIMVRHSPEEGHGLSNGAPQVVLIDFGMAIVYEGRPVVASGSSIMGTNDYMAPEAMRGRCVPASDVWSAGMVLHALLVGHLPSSKHEIVEFGEAWSDVSCAARDLVKQLLELDASSRMTAAQAKQHAWTRGIAPVSLSPKHVKKMVKNFMSFHSSEKLQRAALTALAMQLTNQQMSEQREQFMAIDSDGNGRISKQELIESISASSPLCPQDVRKWAESVFDSIDTDGSQEIDYTEWLAAVIHESTGRSEEAMRAAFRVFDLDGDGKIDEAEFARVVAQTPQEIASLLPQFDTNGDGVIDFDEFKNLLFAGAMESAGQPLRGLSSISNTSEPQRIGSAKVTDFMPPSPVPLHIGMSFSL